MPEFGKFLVLMEPSQEKTMKRMGYPKRMGELPAQGDLAVALLIVSG